MYSNQYMEAISKESCPVCCVAYNNYFLVVVANIIVIDVLFPNLTLEHLIWYVVGSLTN